MKTWDTYKQHVKSTSPQTKKDVEEIEAIATIIGALIEQRNALELSQRQLAAMCGLPQSSVARIESFKTTPNLDTLLKIMRPLGLELKVAVASNN